MLIIYLIWIYDNVFAPIKNYGITKFQIRQIYSRSKTNNLIKLQ